MNEEQFIDSIDACFPSGDLKRAQALATKALSLSPNAVFMVYYELARGGRNTPASRRARLAVLDFLEERFVHPLSGLGSWLVRKMIAEKKISVAQSAAAARAIARFPGCYNILGVAYSACDDVHGKNESLFESIRRRWEKELNRKN